MHGRGVEETKRSWHMLTVPTRVSVADGSSSSSSSSPNSFFKDGRKISVGDCALFKPPQDSLPFIGIIRCVTTGRENKLKLGVNWLYRPAEIKLGKGILLDAALNEIFYSFHKDEIPAASLLHPCKVAFLPKGVDLPSGTSSFVCRRVYDITNNCLWWLTDQDYINERQEEVDQLLYKTRVEMHATVQSGGRSPKPMNGPTAAQVKVESDGVQNSASSFSSLVKGKKRERGDQGSEPVKRERAMKMDDGDSGSFRQESTIKSEPVKRERTMKMDDGDSGSFRQESTFKSEPVKRERTMKMDDGDSGNFRQESTLKSEIAKITEKGGLLDSEGVKKLLQLMLPDENEKKVDLAGRLMLASVIAATDKFDCLSQFVVKGVPVFDEWIQEVGHKGKAGDGNGPKDSDKSIEEFLLVLLRALDKLPVNLNALQMCNIGKSVNHLRMHKNLEIQKKARSLVDTWKKRVEAEMDAKSNLNAAVSWSARPRLPEVSHGGNRHSGGSADVAVKSSVTQLSASKSASVKPVLGDSTKSASVSPGALKSVPSPVSASSNLKDGLPRIVAVGVTVDLPSTTPRDEKSSSSSQSHNNSQSCSNDHARTGGMFGKEDARSSTAGSMNVKVSGGSSRPRKSANGFPGPAVSGVQRETVSSRRSSLHKNPAPEKSSQPGLTSEKVLDGPSAEGNGPSAEGNGPKLIVKIPNRGRSPAQSGSGGSSEDPLNTICRAASPMQKVDAYRATVAADVNNESWQSNDFKDVLTGSDEGNGSPAAVTDEEHCRPGDNHKKIAEVPKAASSSSGNEKSGNLQDASFSSIHALIESCAKYSEGNASLSAGDELGMNLLASVAGEMSKSESPTDSPQRSTPVSEHLCKATDSRVKSPPVDELARDESLSIDGPDDEYEKHGVASTTYGAKNGVVKSSSSLPPEQSSVAEDTGNLCSSSRSFHQPAEPTPESQEKSMEVKLAPFTASPPSTVEKIMGGEGLPLQDKNVVGGASADGSSENKVSDVSSRVVVGKEAIEESSLHPEFDVDGKIETSSHEGSVHTEEKPSSVKRHSELGKGTCKEVLLSSGFHKGLISENVSELKAEKDDEKDGRSYCKQAENHRIDSESNGPATLKTENNDLTTPEGRALGGSNSAATDNTGEHVEENMKSKEANDQVVEPGITNVSPDIPMQEVEEYLRPKRSKLTNMEAEEAEECTSTTADASSVSAAGAADVDAKVEFDLNEGFNADDGKYGEPNNLTAPGCSTAHRLISPVPFAVSSVSSGLPASVTVPAAAKGPCVPPEDLLKSKGGEVGWRGSAATSAFRPAEPRKVQEIPLGTSISVPDPTPSKKGRPALDIDLNVPDERILEDMASQSSAQETCSLADTINNKTFAGDQSMSIAPVRSSGGLDLDLNQVDEASEKCNYPLSNSRRLDNQFLSIKSSGPVNGEVSLRRDFDLNNGPVVDELCAEPAVFSQHSRSSVPSQPPVSGFRMNNTDVGNFSSWFPSGSTYSAVPIPSIMSDRGEQPFPIVATGGPQRMLGPPSGSNLFNPDMYRAPVFSSSPAMTYPSTSFPYPVFPFGNNFPLPSAAFQGSSATYLDSSSTGRLFPAVRSQLLGPAGVVSSSYPRPYVVNLPDGSNNSSGESSKKWGRQGLDLNAGPGGPDLDGRDVTSPLVLQQLSVVSSQALAEDQARMFQMQGGTFKRKEPEGGWDGYRQSSWK